MVGNVSLILLTIKMVLLVSTRAQRGNCFRELELELEIRSALTTLNDRFGSLETQIGKMEERLLNHEENFKKELVKIKDEIIAETEKILPYAQLTSINNEVPTTDPGTSLPSDCKDVQERGFNSSGPYRIHPKLARYPFIVWCDMKTEKGGWTYILNRVDGSEDFNLNWSEYRRGFGNVSGEHWLGLEHMYELTNSKSYKLCIELLDWESIKAQVFYSNFRIGNESEAYPIKSLGAFNGNAGDSFINNIGLKFSTPDRDNDLNTVDGKSCAQDYRSGWWFAHCLRSLLTGHYINNPLPNGDYFYVSSIKWNSFHGSNYSLKEARMMIKPSV